MLMPKKYNAFSQHFVIIITLFLFLSCGKQQYVINKTNVSIYKISDTISKSAEIESFIKPYRDHINKDLSKVLAYAPETLDKKGDWQCTIGNLLADITLQKCNPIFYKREQKSIDICLLNHGGIRSVIPKGDVTARVAYEVMPFENSAIVVTLKGEQIQEMVNYIVLNKKAHPLAGMSFAIDKNNIAINILIQGIPLDKNSYYNVVTSDYLVNGGDNMNFFSKATAKYDLDYKLRNIIIDYFTEVDTIPVINDQRIIVETPNH